MKSYQTELISLLLDVHALAFGDFTLKSGRKSPYFINTGRFDSGATLFRLGSLYARHLVECSLADCHALFGPAYKGIPLAVATACALHREFGRDIAVVSDRKEIKDHGDKGKLLGRQLQEGERVVIVEDVITAGTTMREVIPLLRDIARATVEAVVVLVDRCERGASDLSAVAEVERSWGVHVRPLLTIYDIINHLSSPEAGTRRLSTVQVDAVQRYLEEYGARS